MKTLRLLGGGLFATAFITTAIANDASGVPSTSQGAGAARLSGNAEGSAKADSSHSSESSHGMKLSASDQPGDAKAFLRQALEGNLAEIALAQIAERKAQSSEIKQFAQMIRKDHEQANQKLTPIAQAHGVAATQSLSEKHQKNVDRLQKLNGAEFDKGYATEMLKAHQKDIAKYEQATQQVTESDVKQYAETTLPKLRQHLQHAHHTALNVGVDQSTIASIMKGSDAMGGSEDRLEGISGREKSDSISTPQSTPETP